MLQISSRCSRTVLLRWSRPSVLKSTRSWIRYSSSNSNNSPSNSTAITTTSSSSIMNRLKESAPLVTLDTLKPKSITPKEPTEATRLRLMAINYLRHYFNPEYTDTPKQEQMIGKQELITQLRRDLMDTKGLISGKSFVNKFKNISKPVQTSILHGLPKKIINNFAHKIVPFSRHSQSAELFLLHELNQLLRVKDLRTCDGIGRALVKQYKFPKGMFKIYSDELIADSIIPDSLLMPYYRWVLVYAMKRGRAEFAYNFVMKNSKYFLNYRNELLSLVTLLLLKNPLKEEIQLGMALQVREIFDLKFTELQANIIYEKVPGDATGSLEKAVSLSVLQNLNNDDTDILLNTGYRSIMANFKKNNPAGCHETWLRVKHLRDNIAQHDHQILATLLKVFNKNKKFRAIAKDIVNELPASAYSSPLLTEPLIYLAISLRLPELANDVCSAIKPPITRALLSNLLHLHLSFNDTEGTEKVLQEIHKMGSELVDEDYAAIVSQLLEKRNVEAAAKIVKGIPFQYASKPYSTLMNYYVQKSILQKEPLSTETLAIIDRMARNMSKIKGRSKLFWSRMAASYINYLVSSDLHDDLRLARQIYVNTFLDFEAKQYLETKPELELKYDLSDVKYSANPFMVQSKDDIGLIYLRAKEYDKVVILKIIADAAIRTEHVESLNFALEHLMEAGYTKNEILLDFGRKYQNKISKMGFNPRKLRSYEISEKDRFKDITENDTAHLRFITNKKMFQLESDDKKPKSEETKQKQTHI